MPHPTPDSQQARRIAEWFLGFLAGLVLAAVAIDYGRNQPAPPAPLPPPSTIQQFPGS